MGDLNKIYDSEENQLLNYIAAYALYLNIDYRGSNYSIPGDYNAMRQRPFWNK